MTLAARRTPGAILSLAGLVLALAAAAASATPVPGFVQHWNAADGTAGFGGGASCVNPGAGGALGAGDGFLLVSTPGPGASLNLGATSAALDWTGDWRTAGVARVRFSLSDVGAADPLEIHFAIGNGLDFWQCDTGFIPPAGTWATFTVDLSSATGWTQIINVAAPPANTFDAALHSVDRILLRHDRAPYAQAPDTLRGDVGVDELTLLDATSAVPANVPAPGRPVELSAPWPNPSAGAVTLALRSFDDAPVRLEVLDAGGRRVRTSTLAGTAEHRAWVWDGRGDDGTVSPPGWYRVRAWSRSGGTSVPLVRVAAGH